MNILVTGANGQLGREMQRLSAVSPNNYTFTDVAELDVTDAGAVRQAVAQTRAEVIVNCAAYTNVERAEEDEEAADRLNRGAAENLARAAEANGATLIHVSTARHTCPTRKTPRPHRWASTGARNSPGSGPSRSRGANT